MQVDPQHEFFLSMWLFFPFTLLWSNLQRSCLLAWILWLVCLLLISNLFTDWTWAFVPHSDLSLIHSL